MAFATAVNDQITDSVSQANTKVLGDAPAVAMGNLFVATGQALSNSAHNATNNQQQSYVTLQASTTQAVSTLLSVDTSSNGIGTQDIFRGRGGGVKGLGPVPPVKGTGSAVPVRGLGSKLPVKGLG